MYFSTTLLVSLFSLTLASASASPYESSNSIYAREASSDAYQYGIAHAIARRNAQNKAQADLKKAGHVAWAHHDVINTGICTVGAFIPGADIAIDTACLGVAGAEAAGAAYKKLHHKRGDVYARAAFIQGLKDLDLL